MNFFKKQFNLIIIFLSLVLLLFNITDWKNGLLGVGLFFVYIIYVGKWWQEILYRSFSFYRKTWMTAIFAWFLVFSLLSLFAGIAIVFYKITDLVMLGVYFGVAMITSIIFLWYKKKKVKNKVDKIESVNNNLILFNNNIFLLLGYITFWLLGFFLLYRSGSTGEILSPWQAINSYYLPVFFILTILSGVMLFSKYKTKVILFVFILQSVLLHLYIPMSHELPWGGDVWRHVAVEKQIMAEEFILPVLIGSQAEWQEVANVDLPKVFFQPQKYSYGHMWGATIFLAKTFSVDLLSVNRWLVPVVWGFLIPFILFRIGCLLFDSQRKGLWLVWFSFLPASLQAFGGMTLPVSFGFILFLFTLMLWLQYLRDNNKYQKYLVLFLSVLMLFGYSLYFFLIWFVIFSSFIIKKLLINKKLFIFNLQPTLFKKVCLASLFLSSIFVIPVIEILGKVSFIPEKIAWWENIKQIVGQFTGWFYVSMIRPHDILSGNFLFNHTPDYAYIANIFNIWRWWLVPAMCLVWVIFKFSAWKMFTRGKIVEKVLLNLVFVIFGGYIIGWFMLQGDRLFTRRLELVLAFLVITFLAYGLLFFLQKLNWQKKYLKVFVLFNILLFSWFITFTYTSGPDGRVVSRAEYSVAEYVWDNLGPVASISDFDKHCVLGDTWFLLALEGFSSGQIIGGGFPIDYQFGQADRVRLFNKLTENPEESDLVEMHNLTNVDKCWFIQKSELFSDLNIDKINQIFNSEPEMVDGFFIWQSLEKDFVLR